MTAARVGMGAAEVVGAGAVVGAAVTTSTAVDVAGCAVTRTPSLVGVRTRIVEDCEAMVVVGIDTFPAPGITTDPPPIRTFGVFGAKLLAAF